MFKKILKYIVNDLELNNLTITIGNNKQKNKPPIFEDDILISELWKSFKNNTEDISVNIKW